MSGLPLSRLVRLVRLGALAALAALAATCVSCGAVKLGRPDKDGATPSEEEPAGDTSKLADLERRYAARPNTPFFTRLRSENSKPSQFLDEDTEVGLISTDTESGFSRVKLASGKKGHVPTRLLATAPSRASATGPDPSPAGTGSPDPDPGINPLAPEIGPPESPGSTAPPTLQPHDIPRPRIPEVPLLPVD